MLNFLHKRTTVYVELWKLLVHFVTYHTSKCFSTLPTYVTTFQEELCGYAVAAANFATNNKLPDLTFARTSNGKEDVAVFDFTSLYSAKCSVRVVERLDRRLLVAIVGDSLHEPFWPSGSGCARGFLGVFDVAWMLRNYGLGQQGILRIIVEREDIYKLLAQAKPENLQKKLQQVCIFLEINLFPFLLKFGLNEPVRSHVGR